MIKIVILFCLSLLCTGCAHVSKHDADKHNAGLTFDLQTFNEQKQLWQKSNVTDYQYQLTARGFRSYNGIIGVADGNFMGDFPLNDERYRPLPFTNYSTIDNIYKIIEDTFNRHNNTERSRDMYLTGIFVEYDKTNHIPVKINYTYYISKSIMVDGTFHFEISNFKKADDVSETASPITLPETGIIPLAENTWRQYNTGTAGERWFSFTATEAAQYIHFLVEKINRHSNNIAPLSYSIPAAYIQIYNGIGNSVGKPAVIAPLRPAELTLEAGEMYYIKLWPYFENTFGLFFLTFSESATPG